MLFIKTEEKTGNQSGEAVKTITQTCLLKQYIKNT